MLDQHGKENRQDKPWLSVCSKSRANQRRSAYLLLATLGLCWVFLLSACDSGTINVEVGPTQKQDGPTKSFQVGAQPELVVQNPVGDIHIHKGNAGSIGLSATFHYTGSTNPFKLTSSQDGDTVHVEVTSTLHSWQNQSVDLDLTVPTTTKLNVESNAAEIHVEDIQGQMQIKSDVGAIRLRNCTLQGQGKIASNVGQIDFDGMLDPQSSYTLNTDVGAITASLPSNAAVELKMSSIESKNAFGSDTLGSAPRAQLDLSSRIGSISIEKR
ncbi:hypothetical protein EPA93_12610 [Ktedonosporobacter rubrisoli]|uniref:Uncharacterized protein n=1 Tax=Ktedonosporobacter rubrisoli TaxID=2509675 RepID=A0A4P6JNB4_KTERU|nr:DUF4097 family beta strand repeat-containing protein [Ktedonosporobacter rubrisoli]QBD76799.1 hypothetical protein EPA93_12610 [Ktedonosporobacter rubrisoli]